MSFPVMIEYPSYIITLPCCKKEVKFRPFIEKERKILLMTLESDNPQDIQETIKLILKACCLSPEINVEDLTTVDVEYFFLQIRAKSVGEIVTLNFNCDNIVDDKKCNNLMQIEVDITQIEVKNIKTPKELLIQFSPNFMIQMKYPSFFQLENRPLGDIDVFLVHCIDYVVNGETILYTKDYSDEDILEFVQSLQISQYRKLEEFIEEMPLLYKTLEHVCNKCGYKHEIKLNGYRSFFV